MEPRHSGVATLRSHSHSAAELRPGSALGGGGAMHGAGPSLLVAPGRRLGRRASLARGYGHMRPPAALPLFDVRGAGRQRLPCLLRCPALFPKRVRGGD